MGWLLPDSNTDSFSLCCTFSRPQDACHDAPAEEQSVAKREAPSLSIGMEAQNFRSERREGIPLFGTQVE